MKLWSVEPRDTALFRDGRAFGAGVPALSMPCPWPSTLAGFIRSRLGTDDRGRFTWTPAQARQVAILGPWYALLDAASDEVIEQLYPAPRDLVLFQEEATSALLRRRLTPQALGPGQWSDLPAGAQLVAFATPPTRTPGKPASGPPLWRHQAMQAWLDHPADCDQVDPQELGSPALPRERKIHVKIDSAQQTASPGDLYQVEQLRFSSRRGGQPQRFALMAATLDDTLDEGAMLRGMGSLGGERRMAFVRRAQAKTLRCPEIEGDLVRAILLTPAIFEQGWKPSRLGPEVEVVAACVDRYQPVSGWSFEDRGPKATRRMAPAGSVYWLRLRGDARAWALAHHMTCISDDPQDRRDGFGLIALGRA